MTDEKIKELWERACALHRKGSLAKRIAMLDIEELENAGVTEADIDRLYPPTPAQLWIRNEFVDPCD